MNPVVRVCSHVRSGTHFLLSLLYENYYKERRDLAHRAEQLGHWDNPGTHDALFTGTDSNRFVAWHGLFGGHRFLPPPDTGGTIYVFRDGRDVAASVYRTPHFRGRADGALSFSRFLRKPIDWFEAPDQRAEPEMTLAEHWYRSVSAWLASGAFRVRYEELVADPEGALRRIEAAFGLRPPARRYTGERPVGLAPGAGGAGGWPRLFEPRDLDFFFSVVPRPFEGLWYGGRPRAAGAPRPGSWPARAPPSLRWPPAPGPR